MMGTSVDLARKTPLAIALDLFRGFARNNVRYCHWKSNEHLLEGLLGETDLDVLVDHHDAARCERVLTELSYKRVFSQPWATYPGIEDWLGFDQATGKLVHIHLHYRLWTGRRFVKEQHLPWERLLLDSALEDDQYQVMIADPNIEAVLLAVRAVLKTGYRDRLRTRFFGHCPVSADIIREFEHLYTQIDAGRTRDYARIMLGAHTGDLVADVIIDRSILKARGFRRLLSSVPQSLALHHRHGTLNTLLIYVRYVLYHRYMGIMRRLGCRTVQGKRLHTGGAIVALIGADGSGKSTVTAEIRRWLGWKLSVSQIYLGSGDGDVGFALRLLKWLVALRKKCMTKIGRTKPRKSGGEAVAPSGLGRGLRGLVESLYCFLSARHRMGKILLAKQISGRGGIVLADRYPQNKISDVFDGPPSPPANGSRLTKLLYARIGSRYQRMEQLPPDLVIRLCVSEKAALQRKPDHTPNEIKWKIETVAALAYPPATIVDIDASQPLADVVLDVKKAIWESL